MSDVAEVKAGRADLYGFGPDSGFHHARYRYGPQTPVRVTTTWSHEARSHEQLPATGWLSPGMNYWNRLAGWELFVFAGPGETPEITAVLDPACTSCALVTNPYAQWGGDYKACNVSISPSGHHYPPRVAHELGHCLGFTHPGQGEHVSQYDDRVLSVMNPEKEGRYERLRDSNRSVAAIVESWRPYDLATVRGMQYDRPPSSGTTAALGPLPSGSDDLTPSLQAPVQSQEGPAKAPRWVEAENVADFTPVLAGVRSLILTASDLVENVNRLHRWQPPPQR